MVAVLPTVERGSLSWMVSEAAEWRIATNDEIMLCQSVGGLLRLMRAVQESGTSLDGWCSGCIGLGAKRRVDITPNGGKNNESVIWISPVEGGEPCEFD